MYWWLGTHPPANIKYNRKQQKHHKDKTTGQQKSTEDTITKITQH
jgi:hypothetical protein